MTLAPSHHLALLDQDPQLGDINFLQEHNLGRSVTTNPSAMAVASPQNIPAAMPPWLTGSNHFMSAQTAPYLQSQAPGPSNTWLQGTFEGQEPPQSRAYLRAGSSRSGQSTSSTSSSFGEEAMRNSVPSLVRTPLLQQDAARRGSDDPSNRKVRAESRLKGKEASVMSLDADPPIILILCFSASTKLRHLSHSQSQVRHLCRPYPGAGQMQAMRSK